MSSLIQQIAQELAVQPAQVQATVDLLDGGATVPFIARYRKEATGGLDDVQLRQLQERLGYLRELQERRAVVLRSIEEQGKLTPALRSALEAASSKADLEDLYLPFKPKRRSRGLIAREAGLEPLADLLWADPTRVPEEESKAYVRPDKTPAGDDFTTVAAVLDGVRDLLSERWSEDAALLQALRQWLWESGVLSVRRVASRTGTTPIMPSSAITSSMTSPFTGSPRTVRWLFFGGAASTSWRSSYKCRSSWTAAADRLCRAWPKPAWPTIWAGRTRVARPTT